MSEMILRLADLTVRYGAFTAVDLLSFSVAPGEVFGLLGPNGAGKSSTLRVLIGQRPPTSGTVTVGGLDITRQWQAIKPMFGYVPDRENHFEEFTGRRNLQLFAGLYQVEARRIDEVLGLVELGDAANLPVRAYSLGMRRKLLLARALLHRPRLLYLDEPTANLDVHSLGVVHRILRQVRQAGTAVLLTTHNMKEVEEVCDRVAILTRGRLLALDAPANLRRRHAERLVDVRLLDGERQVVNLEVPDERAALAVILSEGRVAEVHSREFDFHSAFLKLTESAH